MTDSPQSQILLSLNALFENERAVLLSGDLAQLQTIMDEKSKLIDELRALDDRPLSDLEGLRAKAQHNQILFDGALAGIRRVADRLAELRKVRHSFDTYDDTGRRRTIEGQVVHNVEKRA